MNETTESPSDQTGAPTPGAAPDPPTGHASDWEQVKDVGALRRPADRMVAGVAAGLARHLNIDPLVLRVAFVVLSFFGGAGVILYGALWLLLPEDGKPQAPIHLDERSRGVALIGVLALASLALLGDSWGLFWAPWPLAVVAVVVWLLWNRSKEKDARLRDPASATPNPSNPSGPYGPAAHGPGPYGPGPYGAGPTYAQGEGLTPPPAAVRRPPLARPRDPRRRGPVLFWFTLALIALSLGVLGTVDLAGVAVAASAYPALALTISGVMLVIGAFWGRAGGIIAIALVTTIATFGALAGESWQRDDALVFEPATSGEVRDYYELRNGELTLDLTGVTDLDGLRGRDIEIVGFIGRIEVRLPEEVNYSVRAEVAVGSIRLLDQRSTEGLGVAASLDSDPSRETGSRDAPLIQISAELAVGEIVVIQP